MPFGPIIDAELTRLARQRRWYVLRVALGLGLLFLLYSGYEGTSYLVRGGSGEYNDWALRVLASVILRTVLIGQTVAVFFLAPMLCAGAIAEEKQRKTLHYLLASRLSSVEIVVGKLAARLLLVAMPIVMVVPVIVITMILGSFEIELLLVVYAATLTTVVFEASLAILVSTFARRGREALLLTFLLGLSWFVGPTLLLGVMTDLSEPWPSIYYRWLDPINAPLIKLTPIGLYPPGTTLPALLARVRTMMIYQAVGSFVLLALATWGLRPAFRRSGGAAGRHTARGRLGRFLSRRWRPRRPIGDDPMLWKETHGTPGSRLIALVSIMAASTVVLMGYDSLKDSMPRSWRALVENGYRIAESDPRRALNAELRVAAAGLIGVWGLLLMINAATSISREREDDTWISLISTPLPGREILRAKLVGSAWSCRHLAYAILGIIALGTVMGAFHPLGAAIAVAQMAAFGLFVVAAGTLISLRAKTTAAAIGAGVVLLLGLGLIVPLMIGSVSRPGPSAFATSHPVLFACGLLSHPNVEEVRAAFAATPHDRFHRRTREAVFVIGGGSLAYLALGPILLAWAYRRFDRVLDRPRRPVTATAPAHPKSAAPGAGARATHPAGRAG